MPVSEWLASPYVERAAKRIACNYGLLPEDASDLLQEVRLALLEAGPDARLNATWIFHTAMHKAVDIQRQRRPAPSDGRTVSEKPVELLHLLHAKADRLSRQLREFYSLRFEEGLSQRQAAERLGVHRCRIRLLDKMCLGWMSGQGQLRQHRNIHGAA